MRTTYGTILVLAAVVVLSAVLPCRAVEKENIWGEAEPRGGHRWFKLTDEKIKRAMRRLSESEPEKAKELAELREKNPEKFKVELRKAMRERFGEKHRERMKQKASGKYCPTEGTPFMRHSRSGRAGRERERGERGRVKDRLRAKHTEYLEWLEKNYPEEAEKLAKLKEKKPELYMKRFWVSRKRYGRIAEAMKDNPKLAEALKEDLELKDERDKLLRRIRAASNDKEKKKLVEELEKVVSDRFDLIVKRKQISYEQLRNKLEELKKQVKKSEAEVEKWKDVKDGKVKERLEELISRTEEFDWD